MGHYPKFSLQERWICFLLLISALTIALSTMQITPVFSAACNPATPLDASGGSASCTMAITAQVNPGVLTLANDAAAVVAGTPFTLAGTAILATFTFTSVVDDHRGLSLGWVLSAASAGIINGSTTLPLSFTALDAASSCSNGTCATATFIPITLTTTTARFLTTSNAGHTIVVDGNYTNKIDGAFTIPTGSPSGTYAGSITITLLNTF